MAERNALSVLLFNYVIATLLGVTIVFQMLWQIIRRGRSAFFNVKQRDIAPKCLNDNALGEHGYLTLKDVKLHYVASGPSDKPLMLFLHGFPEFWYSWRYQIREFSKDYRTVAIDMRGYCDSDKPKGVSSYSMDKLRDDVRQVIEGLGYQKCFLVAHDWGGAVAFNFTIYHPELVEKLIVCNIPHPKAFRKHIATSTTQKKKSWYILFFQLPGLPELFFRQFDYKTIERTFRGEAWGTKRRGAFSDEDIEAFKYAFSREGAMTAAINYYRAALRYKEPKAPGDGMIEPPVCMIWGNQDGALDTEMAALTGKYCKDFTLHYVEGCSHWVQQEEPDKVNHYMREFLSGKKLE